MDGTDREMTRDELLTLITELEAEVQQQAKIIGESIDDHDKLVMEKRALEAENKRLKEHLKRAQQVGTERVVECASLRSTLAQVRGWKESIFHVTPETIQFHHELDSILSTDQRKEAGDEPK